MQHFSFSWLQNRQLTANSTATSAPLPHWTHQHIICITAEIRFHFHSLFSSSLNHRLETKWNSKNIRLIWQSEYLLELNWSRHYVSKGCLCLHSTKRKNRPHSPGVNTRIHYTNHLDDFTAESTKKQTPPNVHWMHRFFGTTVKDVFKYPWTERDWNVLDLCPKRTATQRKPYNNKHNQTLKSLWHLQLKLRVFTAHIQAHTSSPSKSLDMGKGSKQLSGKLWIQVKDKRVHILLPGEFTVTLLLSFSSNSSNQCPRSHSGEKQTLVRHWQHWYISPYGLNCVHIRLLIFPGLYCHWRSKCTSLKCAEVKAKYGLTARTW